MSPAANQEGALSVRDQIERYRSAFVAVVVMVIIAAVVGGYILAHENLKLPGWVPVLGRNYYTLRADFQTAQALTPGQGQAVTIAGAKIGEISTVDVNNGVAVVTMRIIPKYARIYRNTTMLMRPKTGLQDMTLEVNPGTPSAGKLKSGETVPLSQTAPNIDFDEFLAGLDGETRAYLQELVAGAGEGLYRNGRNLAAVFRRFPPAAHFGQEIAKELEVRHANIARSIHNFRLLTEAVGGKDKQLAQLVDASNAVFATFAHEDANLQKTLILLPGALHKTSVNLAKVATASNILGPTLHKLQPFASALGPANTATRKLALTTTPIFKNEIRPFAREILPVVNELGPSTKQLGEAFPKLAVSFKVLNEFFNELAYNPGPSKAGFLFFLDWGNHNLNSVVSSSDAHGPLGRSLVYFNCEVLPILNSVASVNETVKLLVGLLRPPNGAECVSQGLKKASAAPTTPASAHGHKVTPAGGPFTGLGGHAFSGAPAAGTAKSAAHGSASAPARAGAASSHAATSAGGGGG
jgi:phospholipid/cholesterol/gamma-HCH transport system substrate-binding protein